MTVTVQVHSKTNPAGASIRTLGADFNRSAQRIPNEPGGLAFTLPIGDADETFLEPHHWIKVARDGVTIMGGRLGVDDANVIDQNEEAGEFVQVKVAGALETWADAHVYRPGWFEQRPADMRWFGPMSPEYTGWTAWDPPAFYVRQDYALSPYGTLFPEGWNAGEAGWIWPTAFDALSSPPQAVGRGFFAAVGTLPDEGDQLFEIAADDGYRFWIDGILVGERTEAFAWKQTDRWPVFLTAGSHYFFIEGINIDRPSSPATNGAAIIFAWFTLVGGGEYGDLVGFSSDSWNALGYPATPIGMTAGDILERLFNEAQFRGALKPWSIDFTATLDSAGNAWDRQLTVGFRIGQNYLDVIRTLAAHAVDVKVDYDTLTLRMFNKGSLDSTPAVTLVEGATTASGQASILSLVPRRTPALATDARVKTADNKWQERSSGVADVADGDPPRIEAYIELGSGASDLDVPDQVDPVLDAFSTPKDRTAVSFMPGIDAVPFVDFDEFDTIQAPNRKRATVASTPKAITMSEQPPDQDGAVGGTQMFTIDLEQVAV